MDTTQLPFGKGRPVASPAFQFYPKEFLSSSKVIAMTAAERGAYITLLSTQWLDGSLPNDLPVLARLTGIPTKQFIRLWPLNLARCFISKGGRLVNDRMERQRKELEAYVANCKEGGKRSAQTRKARYGTSQPPRSEHRSEHRSEPRSDDEVTPNTASPTASAIASPKEQKISAEPSNGSSPPVLTFPTVGPLPTWELSELQLAEWQGLFQNIDVMAEMRKAVAWLPANPAKRKTAKGMPRFLVAWLTRAVDSGNGNGHSSTHSAPRTSAAQQPIFEAWTCPHVEDHSSRWRCDQATQLGLPRKA